MPNKDIIIWEREKKNYMYIGSHIFHRIENVNLLATRINDEKLFGVS